MSTEQTTDPGLSIFSIGANKEKMDASMFQGKFDSPLFDPRVKQAGDQIVFIIRAMPYVLDPLHSMASKNYYALKDALGIIMFDSRTSFNRPAEQHYEFCPPSDVWMKLRKSQDPEVKKISGWIRQQRANHCYVQIVNYPSDPSYNGKIMPMRIPVELVKLFDSMSNPSDQDKALGTKSIQPFDIMSSKNIKCTVTGHTVDNTLMRKWKCELDGDLCEAKFPLGKDNAMTPVSKLDQKVVIEYFKSQQTINLQETYGYQEPSVENKRRMKALLQSWTNHIPGMPQITSTYFPELADLNPVDQNAMAPSVFGGQPLPGQPLPDAQNAGNPMGAPAVTPPAQPVPPTTTELPTAPPPAPPATTTPPAAANGVVIP